MKTTDLIPIILYQLVDGDKYGYEIVKQIEDGSNGEIVIKQPTLYSVLKKLEQGKFITSYWQDSEIGGKRHYYKLTDNGKAQLDTYPPFEILIKDAMENEGVILPSSSNTKESDSQIDAINTASSVDPIDSDTNSILVENKDNTEIRPIHIDLTLASEKSSEFTPLFDNKLEDDLDNRIDNKFEPISFNIADSTLNSVEIETPNANKEFESTTENKSINIFDAIDYNDATETKEIVTDNKNEEISNSTTIDEFENDIEKDNIIITIEDNVTDFNNKVSPIPEIVTKNDCPLEENQFELCNQVEQVQFLNYVDLKTNPSSISRKKAISKRIQKMSLTCVTLFIALIISIVLCNKYSFSKLYYISAIFVGLILVLYPIVLLVKVPKIKLKYCTKPFTYSRSRDFFIKLSLFLSLIIFVFSYNLSITSSVKNIFTLNNFANFLAPILLSGIIMIDFIYSAIIYKDYRVK